MNINQLLSDEDAVSPVIGVILMVAITVILAAVIGTFVLGLGDQVQSSAPNSNFQFAYEGDFAGSPSNGAVTITHNGGQDVDVANVDVQVGSAGTQTFTGSDWATTISTGDDIRFYESNNGDTSGVALSDDSASPGDTIRVIWQSDSGGSSNTIGQSTIPS